MIEQIKIYVVIAIFALLLGYGSWQRLKVSRLEQRIAVYEVQREIARVAYEQQLALLQRQEQANVKARAVVDKQMATIMADTITGGCEGAINYGRQYAKQFKMQLTQ